jgi:hypothetical protein
MNESERLAVELEKALGGNAWHGPSWREVLDGVTRLHAQQRPLPQAHTIAEIVAHATVWHDIVRRRLNGEDPPVTPAEDWPAIALPDVAAWEKATSRLLQTGHALAAKARTFPSARLHETRAGKNGTWFELIIGELQHTLYHAGQAALLRKAMVSGSTRAG